MTFRNICLVTTLMTGFLITTSPAAALNTISLSTIGASPLVGEFVDVQISMTFDDSTFGGGVALTYDQSVLSFDSFVFDGAFTANSGVVRPVSGSIENPLIIQFGWFFTPSPIGETAIGTFRFLANAGTPMTTISSAMDTSSPFAGSLGELTVDFSSTQLAIVPEPGSALLLLTGLAMLAVRRGSNH